MAGWLKSKVGTVILGGLLLACPLVSYSEILILVPEAKEANIVAEMIRKHVPEAHIAKDIPANSNPSLVVTLGEMTYEKYKNIVQAPIIAAWLPAFLNYGYEDPSVRFQHNVTSPEDVLEFTLDTFGEIRLGYVHSDNNDPYLRELFRLGPSFNIEIIAMQATNQTLYRAYKEFNNAIDVMLIPHNPEIYNGHNLRFALEALYRNRIPGIGLTKDLIGSGVTVAIFPERASAVKKIVDLIHSREGDSGTHYPDDYVKKFDPHLVRNYKLALSK